MPDIDVLSKSVTRDDYPTQPKAGILHFHLPQWSSLGTVAPDLPPFWSMQRDAVLLGTIFREPVWAAAVSKAVNKETAKSWKVESEVDLRAKRAQELFISFDSNRGWVGGMAKHLQSYLLTGNGAFVEIVRATAAAGARILGLVPLDSLRCLRTGDSAVPVIYRDRKGREHEMKDYQVFMLADMPDQSELWYGVGHCAAERAYTKILQMEGLERYLLEKLTGRRPLAVHIINGMRSETITGIIETAQEDAQRKGLSNYMGAAIAGIIDPGATPGLVTIPLAEVPEGFDAEKERSESKLVYADAIGLDPQDLDPRLISRGALGGAQSVVLAEKVSGTEAWPKDWSHAVNQYVLDDRTTWTFEESDLRDQLQAAQVTQARAGAVETMVNSGVITPPQGTQKLVDWDELPKEFLPVDVTPDEELSDEEKPESEEEQTAAPVPEVPATPIIPAPAPPSPAATSKELEYFVERQIETLNAAMQLSSLKEVAEGEMESRRLQAVQESVRVIRELVETLKQEAVASQMATAITPLPPEPQTLDLTVPVNVYMTLPPAQVNVAAPNPTPIMNQVETPLVLFQQGDVNVTTQPGEVTAKVVLPTGEKKTTSVVRRDLLGRVAELEQTEQFTETEKENEH